MQTLRFAPLFLAALAATLAPGSATAEQGSVCVICNEPARVYQCNYTLNENLTSLTGVNIKGLQFNCIKEIADYGGHGQCAAARRTSQNCNGEPYQLRNVPAPLRVDQQEVLAGEEEQIEKPITREQPTLVETSKETYKKTTSGIKKGYEKTAETVEDGYKKTTSGVKNTVKSIGSTIGDAASVTYDCVVSFFTKCGN